METVSALLALCVGNSPVTDEFPLQRPVTPCFDGFFDLRLNKQSWDWWFETPSRSLWRHCNVRKTTLWQINNNKWDTNCKKSIRVVPDAIIYKKTDPLRNLVAYFNQGSVCKMKTHLWLNLFSTSVVICFYKHNLCANCCLTLNFQQWN